MDLAAPPSLGDAGAGKPLTAEQQKRFAAGQQVFQNLCIACHGANGRGQPGLGPSLAGSKWVTGRAGLTARIILNGKDGEKMMPPLSDADRRSGRQRPDVRAALVGAHRLRGQPRRW